MAWMRRAFFTIFLLPVLALASCTSGSAELEFPPPSSGIIPASSPEIPLVGLDAEADSLDRTPGILNQPRIALPVSLISHQTIDLNLDADEVDEQIIVVKQREDPEDLVRIIVVDYDQPRGSYFLSWTGASRSTNLRALTVYSDDVTGNQLPDILVFGLNRQGEQTLDIFQWDIASTIYGIQYRPILSVQADTGIEILDGATAPGMGKTVVVVNRDLGSTNALDTIRSTYTYRNTEGRFLQASSTKVSGASQAQSQLADLYAAPEAVFLNFLRGPWYKEEAGTSISEPETLKIISFDPELDHMTFYRPGRALDFHWVATTKAVYGGRVRIDLRNTIIPSVQAIGTINLASLDSLSLAMTGADNWISLPGEWNGTYKRLPAATRDELSQSRNQGLKVDPIQLAGLYRAADGSELFFSNPGLVLRTRASEDHGGYAIFSYGETTVLQVMFLNPNGTVDRNLAFQIVYQELEDAGEMKRVIDLEPVALRSSGITPQGGGRLRFEQIVTSEP